VVSSQFDGNTKIADQENSSQFNSGNSEISFKKIL